MRSEDKLTLTAFLLWAILMPTLMYINHKEYVRGVPPALAYAMAGVTHADNTDSPHSVKGAYDPVRAVAYLRTALKLNPLDVHSANNLGIAYERCGNLNNAEYSFLYAMAISDGAYQETAKNNLKLLYAKHPTFFNEHRPLEVALNAESKSPLYGGYIVMEQEYNPGMWRTK